MTTNKEVQNKIIAPEPDYDWQTELKQLWYDKLKSRISGVLMHD